MWWDEGPNSEGGKKIKDVRSFSLNINRILSFWHLVMMQSGQWSSWVNHPSDNSYKIWVKYWKKNFQLFESSRKWPKWGRSQISLQLWCVAFLALGASQPPAVQWHRIEIRASQAVYWEYTEGNSRSKRTIEEVNKNWWNFSLVL